MSQSAFVMQETHPETVQCRCSAGGAPVGVGEVHAGGQNPAEEVAQHEATSQAVGRDLQSGEDPREHLEHGPERMEKERKKKKKKRMSFLYF